MRDHLMKLIDSIDALNRAAELCDAAKFIMATVNPDSTNETINHIESMACRYKNEVEREIANLDDLAKDMRLELEPDTGKPPGVGATAA